MRSVNLYDELYTSDASRVALVVEHEPCTYAELHRRIDATAGWLQAQNVAPHDRVGIRKLNSFDSLIAYYGCFKIGAVPVPLPFDDAQRIEGAVQSASINLQLSKDMSDATDALDEAAAKLARQSATEAMVIFTSGTTSSTLKGVRLAHAAVSGTCQFMNQAMEVDPDINECVFAPLDHAFGLGRCHAILSIGGTASIPSSPGRLLSLFDIVEQGNCNALSTTPAILSSLIRVSPEDLKRVGANIRWLQTGAMRFDPFFRENLITSLPGARIFLHYGLSEAMRVTFFELGTNQHKLHTEGPPAQGVELAILDDDMNTLASGEEGIIAIRGRNLCLGYLDEQLWQDCLYKDWFVTSDRGRIDEDGFLEFRGRNDDTINNNGVLINPDEIESKIQPHMAQQSLSIVGVPDPMGVKDSIVVLCVEGENDDISLATLAKKMADTDAHLIPQKIVNVDTLPRTRTNKINRAELRKQIIAQWTQS